MNRFLLLGCSSIRISNKFPTKLPVRLPTRLPLRLPKPTPLIPKAEDSVDKNELEFKLLDAAKSGDVEAVEELLKKGANVNFQNREGKTPLHFAAENNYEVVASALLKHNADQSIASDNGTPLHHAAMKNSEKVAELLIKHGADVMATDSSDETPLHYTAVHDAEELADLLIRNGADVDAKNSFGRTPLIYAIAFGNMMEVAEMLIENGANVNIQDDIGETPLKWAKWKNKQKLVELLERHMEHE